MSLKLERLQGFEGARPVVLVIMDGVGIGKYVEGDYVRSASMPTLAWLKEHGVYTQLKAHGRAVGMPSDADMGNSEIGHNAIGCGRVYDQGAALVGKAVESGSMFEGKTWQELVANVKGKGTTLHFIGLLSDGNVHSHLDHLKGMLQQAAKEGVKRVRIHALIDGRDVPPTSALDYVRPFEAFLAELNGKAGVDYAIASGGGRMNITMDRYEADWSMVERGWKTHVRGEGERFPSAQAAIEAFRARQPGVLGHGGARLGMPCARRGAAVRLRRGRHRDLPRRDSRRARPGSARVRRRQGRPAAGPHRRWRQRGAVQLPRRPGHRAVEGVRAGRRVQGVRPGAAAGRAVRGHDAV